VAGLCGGLVYGCRFVVELQAPVVGLEHLYGLNL
jgi:hypothetical protein